MYINLHYKVYVNQINEAVLNFFSLYKVFELIFKNDLSKQYSTENNSNYYFSPLYSPFNQITFCSIRGKNMGNDEPDENRVVGKFKVIYQKKIKSFLL